MKKTRGQKSHATVPLNSLLSVRYLYRPLLLPTYAPVQFGVRAIPLVGSMTFFYPMKLDMNPTSLDCAGG